MLPLFLTHHPCDRVFSTFTGVLRGSVCHRKLRPTVVCFHGSHAPINLTWRSGVNPVGAHQHQRHPGICYQGHGIELQQPQWPNSTARRTLCWRDTPLKKPSEYLVLVTPQLYRTGIPRGLSSGTLIYPRLSKDTVGLAGNTSVLCLGPPRLRGFHARPACGSTVHR